MHSIYGVYDRKLWISLFSEFYFWYREMLCSVALKLASFGMHPNCKAWGRVSLSDSPLFCSIETGDEPLASSSTYYSGVDFYRKRYGWWLEFWGDFAPRVRRRGHKRNDRKRAKSNLTWPTWFHIDKTHWIYKSYRGRKRKEPCIDTTGKSGSLRRRARRIFNGYSLLLANIK